MRNRLDDLFESGRHHLLSVFYTAGFPELADTLEVAEVLEKAGVDLLEIGIPFSDPIADGPVIQASSEKAIRQGMRIAVLLDQLRDFRQRVKVPVLLMGYFNPILQFGVDAFCQRCQEAGVDGLIVPDMPLWEYETRWKEVFEAHGLCNVFLITPQTPEERIRKMDELSRSFLYMVSSAAVTGGQQEISAGQEAYFRRIEAMQLRSPRLIGFGINDPATFSRACRYARGAIVGSALIRVLDSLPPSGSPGRFEPVTHFIHHLKSTLPAS
jgi:tryptophan synthase alpha chain